MKKYIRLSYLLLGITALSSCLKDTNLLDPSINNTPNVIEISNYGIVKSGVASTYPLYYAFFDVVSEIEFPITIKYAGAYTAPEDITVTLALKPDVLTTYNTENKSTYVLLPDSLYSVPSTTVTIPKGGRLATFTVKLKTLKFDLTKNFALPVSIMTASKGTISGNFGNAVYYIRPSNKWDATYTLKGESTNEATASLSGTIASKDYTLITGGANNVYLSAAHPVPSGTALAATYVPVYTVNADNSVTVTSRNPGTVVFENSPGYTSKYDPASKTIFAKWRYALSATAYRTFTDTLVYKSARP